MSSAGRTSAGLRRVRAVRPGATLAVVSPAGAARVERVQGGLRALEAAGYRTKLMPNALARGPLYFAGTVEQRAADLQQAFADPDVDAVLCTRGGWGCAELLPHLDADRIGAAGKALIGFSDVTSLHTWLMEKAGIVSFQGPMAAADWWRESGVDLASWNNCLQGETGWRLAPEQGLRVLRPGRAEGVLWGGCLAIVAEALGTAWSSRPGRGGVLFLEDIGVKPYQWDRMLLHLRYAGMLDGVTGILLGDMEACCNDPGELAAMEQSILHALRDFAGPIGIGLKSGHVEQGNVTLPWGVTVRLELDSVENPAVYFPESAVE